MKPQPLLIDLGNTRIKWRLGDESSYAALEVADFAAQTEHLSTPSQILACVVGDEQRYIALTELCQSRWHITPQRLQVSRQALDVHNHYAISQQGCDRWAAILGARTRFPAQNLLIISAGTALVLDTLTADGQFLGGTISPGLRLMKQALQQGTANLPLASGEVHVFPRATHDAIESGCQRSIKGILSETISMLNQQEIPPEQILVFGGDAALIQSLLNVPSQTVDNLVLDGLFALYSAADGVFSQ